MSGYEGFVRAVIAAAARWTPAQWSGPEGSTTQSAPPHASAKVADLCRALQEGEGPLQLVVVLR